MRSLSFIILLSTCVMFSSASANNHHTLNTIDFEYYGFLTQSLVKTDGNNYFGQSNGQQISMDFRELGIGANLFISKKFSLAGLLLSRTAGETDDGRVRFDYAKIEYGNINLLGGSVSIRVGRLKLPFGLFNETRDVATTRPSILLPQSLYYDHARQYLINADGVQLDYLISSRNHIHNFKFSYLRANTVGHDNKETEAYYLGRDFSGRLDAVPGDIFTLEYNNNKTNTTLRAQYSDHTITYKPAVDDFLLNGEIHNQTSIFSAIQYIHNYTIIGEIFYPTLSYNDFGAVIPDKRVNPLGRYLQLNYRHNSYVEFYVRYDETFVDASDKNGHKLSALTGRKAHNFFAYDKTFGLRYFPAPKFSVGVEYHDIVGTAFLPIQDNPNFSTHERYWRMLLIQASYTF